MTSWAQVCCIRRSLVKPSLYTNMASEEFGGPSLHSDSQGGTSSSNRLPVDVPRGIATYPIFLFPVSKDSVAQCVVSKSGHQLCSHLPASRRDGDCRLSGNRGPDSQRPTFPRDIVKRDMSWRRAFPPHFGQSIAFHIKCLPSIQWEEKLLICVTINMSPLPCNIFEEVVKSIGLRA